MTIWFPQHLARDEDGELPEAAGLDVLPIWGVDTVAEPGRLLAETLQHFHDRLRSLDTDSLSELETFLSEPLLRGTLPMQREGGVFSPVLLDTSGRAIGMFQLRTDVTVGEPLRQSVAGKINLESHLTQLVKIDAQSKFSSGASLSGSVGPALTGDHSEGHPEATRRVGGGVLGRVSAQAATSGALNQSAGASLMHEVRTKRSHLLAPATVEHTLVFHRAGGGQETFEPGEWPAGMHLRVMTAEDAEGHAPTAEELRRLPAELEHLRSIGANATPLAVTGAEPLFVHAENWLRREGFLPPDTHTRNRVLPDEALVQAQLNNLRRFEQARSQIGQRAATDAMLDGGHSLFLEIPTVPGSRRVRLVLSAERGAGESTHTTVLPHVEGVGLISLSTVAADQNGSQYGVSYGAGGSFGIPVRDGAWTLGGTGDHVRSHQVQHDNSVQVSVGHDQQFQGTGAGQHSEVFEVPADFALDLYEGPGRSRWCGSRTRRSWSRTSRTAHRRPGRTTPAASAAGPGGRVAAAVGAHAPHAARRRRRARPGGARRAHRAGRERRRPHRARTERRARRPAARLDTAAGRRDGGGVPGVGRARRRVPRGARQHLPGASGARPAGRRARRGRGPNSRPRGPSRPCRR